VRLNAGWVADISTPADKRQVEAGRSVGGVVGWVRAGGEEEVAQDGVLQGREAVAAAGLGQEVRGNAGELLAGAEAMTGSGGMGPCGEGYGFKRLVWLLALAVELGSSVQVVPLDGDLATVARQPCPISPSIAVLHQSQLANRTVARPIVPYWAL
jgi:hypothetical protein